MRRILLPCSAALAACTPSPQDTAMRSATPIPTSAVQSPSQDAADPGRAAQGPMIEPVSAEGTLLPTPSPASHTDTPAEATGRRILSTAYVRVGPDGHLTVELHDGRAIVLRNVVMKPATYCGKAVSGAPAGKSYCGGYADIAGVRPGGGPIAGDTPLVGGSATGR